MQEGSYLLIEPGMTVRGTDADLGTVAQVIADEGVDVFRGIVLSRGLLLHKQSLILADHISGVSGSVVHVTLTKTEADHLPPLAETAA